MDVLNILAWNVYIGNKPREVRPELRKILETQNPEVAGLMEATRMHGHLGGLGYQVVQLKPKPLKPGNQAAQANVAILVRNDIKLKKKRALKMSEFWIGPKHGWPQDPRVYRSVKIKWKGETWKIGVAHTPFGVKAREESKRRLVKWFNRSKRRPTVLVLDANMSLGKFRHDIAGPSGAISGGVGIDLIAVKNAQLHDTKNLGKHGSDHPAMLYTVIKR